MKRSLEVELGVRVVCEAEKQILRDDLSKVKEELLHQREQGLAKESQCLKAANRLTELEQQLQKIRIERDRLVNVCSELKAELNNLQNRIARQEPSSEELKYKSRIEELEGYVRELSKHLKKLPQSEEQKLEIEGTNVEQVGRPLGPPAKNTERQTLSQQKAASKMRKDQMAKAKPKVWNYNVKDD